MAKRQAAVNPAETISAMRNDALLAYIEWPVFLHIRLKEVNEALAITGEHVPVPIPAATARPETGNVPVTEQKKVDRPDPEPEQTTRFVPELPVVPETDAVTDFLAQFPDGEGSGS